jgi:hypothetical protein
VQIYKTRVKPITSNPIFNAGTERFVRDWRTAHFAVKVMDSRMRENDAVLGIVFLKVYLLVSLFSFQLTHISSSFLTYLSMPRNSRELIIWTTVSVTDVYAFLYFSAP